ncbi:cell-cycle control medial ring component-domain-containing protein [Cercophora newfieldiana]|uniref:Cell-cycle control medial ring component-domain-containing protein n=1 Tax=Cercophora newfieldiana TaxID=92897 RepID=A0AA40CTV4_9PEZI|nr:cell-cycle control medial ring component-domain-containing protein [Cercophora newfieldiana]
MAATEVSFAKSFLSLLDTKPTKITADHVEDPTNYPASTPHTLPLAPSQRPLAKRTTRPASLSTPGSTPALTVLVRSLRNPPLDISLPALEITTTSALDIKNAVHAATGIPTDKLKLLYNKKPVGDSKTLKDVLGDGAATKGSMEFSVMVMGGAATLAAAAAAKEAATTSGSGGDVAQGLSGERVLATGEFWSDLRGFLQQRVRDEKVAGEAADVFEKAWKGRS